MADTREIFTIIEDATGEGQGLLARTDGGQLASAGNHAGVLAFKDSSGNDVKPQLDAQGKLPVSFNAGTEVKAHATAAGVKDTPVDVVSLTGLTVSKTHVCSLALGAATQTTRWDVVQVDDATETVIAKFITGPGQFSYDMDLELEFVTGATGAQSLKLVGTQLQGSNTDLHGTIKAVEAP